MSVVERAGAGLGLRNPGPALDSYSFALLRHQEQVMSEWAEATTMSRAGPVTCSAFTVIDPLDPPDELVCSLIMTLIPPGREIERFGLEFRIDWPATVKPTSCAFPLVLAVLPLHVALELDFTAVAATSPFNRFTSRRVDCD